MANLRSSKKAIRQIATLTARNRAEKSALKTWQKKLQAACDSKNPNVIKTTAIVLMSKLDKAKKHGLWHANKVNRLKSRLAPLIFQKIPSDQTTPVAQA